MADSFLTQDERYQIAVATNMKPNFLVIGAQKCATSTLCEILSHHPDIFMSTPKEPHFFSREEVWSLGWEWYEKLFAAAEGKKRIGEGSTSYSMRLLYPEAAERIVSLLPDVRVIYIVRHPLKRIESHWLHLSVHGGRDGIPETRSFSETVRLRLELIDNSLYGKQIDVYRQLLGDERIHVVFNEDLLKDPSSVLASCHKFLGVDPIVDIYQGTVRSNVSAEKRPDSPLLRNLRRIPGFDLLPRLMPAFAKDALKKKLTGEPIPRPEWQPELRESVWAQIEADNRAFLKRYGKPEDFWKIRSQGA